MRGIRTPAIVVADLVAYRYAATRKVRDKWPT